MDMFFGPKGPLAATLPNFTPREQQQEMANAVAHALTQRDVLVTEAGTGTGKTYAYLVPAIQHGGKVIISTGTKTLQDQLFYRDLPTLQKALKTQSSVALLKGRSNYLCHYRLQQAEHVGRLDDVQSDHITTIKQWLKHTTSGDIAQCNDVSEKSPIWPQVTSTVDNCLGADCPEYAKCFVLNARRNAQEADIVVINHYLFFIDLALKDEGFGEILPNVEAVIFDEAHQIVDIARHYFGESVSSRQIHEVLKDAELERKENAADDVEIPKKSLAVERSLKALQMVLGDPGQRTAWQDLSNASNVQYALAALLDDLQAYVTCLQNSSVRSPGLEKFQQRAKEFTTRLSTFCEDNTASVEETSAETLSDNHMDDTHVNNEHRVSWYETHEQRFVLHSTPVNIADMFQHHIELSHCAWIFTSATLSVGKRFDHFTRELGLTDPTTYRWDSPFDYSEQTLLYVPTNMPQPNDTEYARSVVEAALPIIQALGGRTFFLLTSYDALARIRRALSGQLNLPVLVQGDLPKAVLLEKFKSLGNAVLLGTYSFWEGVDVKGSALSCVIIDKLPFAAPGDPVMQAQLKMISQRQGNPFMELQLPQAVIKLKQGVGRLIRDENDMGLLMICDPRLFGKNYGRVFFRSLPKMLISRELDQVVEFITEKL